MVTLLSSKIKCLMSQLTEEPGPADEQPAQSVPLPADQPVPTDHLGHPGPASQPTEGDVAVPDDNREKGFMVHTFELMFYQKNYSLSLTMLLYK